MAEIILSPDEGLEAQMRRVMVVADGVGGGLGWDVHWHPRPDKPHGGVVVVPEVVAKAYTEHQRKAAVVQPDDEADSDAEVTDTKPLPDDAEDPSTVGGEDAEDPGPDVDEDGDGVPDPKPLTAAQKRRQEKAAAKAAEADGSTTA